MNSIQEVYYNYNWNKNLCIKKFILGEHNRIVSKRMWFDISYWKHKLSSFEPVGKTKRIWMNLRNKIDIEQVDCKVKWLIIIVLFKIICLWRLMYAGNINRIQIGSEFKSYLHNQSYHSRIFFRASRLYCDRWYSHE